MAETTEDGLPIFNSSQTTDEGLPILKKKEATESTPSVESGSQDLSAPAKQEVTPSSQNTEPIDLPASYQNDRSNYKDLVSGGKYKLLHGSKPVTGTWDAEKQQFVKDPLLDYTVKPKEQGLIESSLPYPLNVAKPESEESTLGRVATDAETIRNEAADKFVSAQYLSSFQPIQQLQTLEEAYKENPTEQLKQSIDTLKSKKLSDTDFEGIRFEGDKNVYQGILPAPRVGEQLVENDTELPKLPKTDMTVGEAYNEMQDNKEYVKQAVEEVNNFDSFVNQTLAKKLPEDKQQYLSTLLGTPMYNDELIKSLEQSDDASNVAIAYAKGLEKSLNGIYEAGSTVGLDEKQLYDKMLTDYNKEQLFGYKPQTFGAEVAQSLGGLTPDVVGGAINPALFIASFGSRMPEEQLKNYYFDKIAKGEKPNFNEAWKYATASTALQGALMLGAGAVGGAGKQIIGETFGRRAAEIITETAKRAGKDAVAFGYVGTKFQNQINKTYGVTQNNAPLKSMVDYGLIGGALALVHLSPQALKGRISEKTKNEVTDMAAFMPPAYVDKLIKSGVETGKITDAEGNAITERMNTVRRIASELPKELSLDEINELVPLYEAKDKLLLKQKDASPTIKDVLKGQIADLDQKILVKASIPLSAEEKAERASLIKKEATGEGDIDKLRLKQLNARHEAVQKSKEQAKANEIAQEAGFDHAKHLLNSVKKEGLGEFETVQEVPKETLEELNAKQQQKLEANKKLSELMPELGGEKEVEAEIKNEPTEEELATIPDVEEAKIPDTDLTHSEAVKFLDDHAVQDKIDVYSARPDFGMNSKELEVAIRHIREGKLDGVSAKKMLQKIDTWKRDGNVDMIALSGGATHKLYVPFEVADFLDTAPQEQVDNVVELQQKAEQNIKELDDLVAEKFTDADGNLDVQKLAQEIADAKGELYFGDLLALTKEDLLHLQNIVENEKGDKTISIITPESKSKISYPKREATKPATEPTAEVKGDYKTLTEEIEMPDGEKGVKVTIEKPDGEKVEIGNMYPEDVEKEVAKKIKGFELQKSKPTKTEEPVAEKATEDLTGKEVAFQHAGSERKGIVQSVDKDGNYKVKSKDGTNYTVKPENARTPEVLNEAKKSLSENLKKLQNLSKKTEKKETPPTLNTVVSKDIITAPFKALGFGDKLISVVTTKIEDGVAKSFRRGMDNSNKYVSRGSSEAQGLFKQLALSQADIEVRRKGLGQMNVAPLKAVKFYEDGVNIVGKTPESLQNVHQVLDPEVYTERGMAVKTEADLSPSEKNLYGLLRATNDMIHDWHYVNGRISEETYLKNKGTYAPRFYDNIEFEGLPEEIKSTFEDYAKQQNFSYVKERKNFADVMQGNVITEDPVYGTSMRLAQMLRNQAMMDYAATLNSRIKTYSEGDANIPNAYVKLEGGGRFGNINTYGELTNKYVPRDVAEDFKGAVFINQAINDVYNAFKWYNRLGVRKLLNKTKTIYNPITQLGNIGSNYVFAMMNGIDPLTFQNRKFEAAKEVKEQSPIYVKLVEEGILGTDVTTKDLKETAKDVTKEKGTLGKIDDKITEFYASRDDIAKVAAYLAHTKDYGRSESEALKRVSEGFQNYNNVGRFYDFASKAPVVGNPFIKFKGDLLRIMKNNFSQRPLTNIALLVGLNTIASAFSKWSDEDEVQKKARERRPFIPKVPLPNKLGGDIPLVWQTPIGEMNAARYFSPFNIYDMGDRGSTVEEVTQFLPIQLKKYEGASVPLPNIADPFLGVYAQVAFDQDFRGKPILDPEETKWREGNATTEEKIQNASSFIARQQIPFYANASDFIKAYNGEPDYYGRNRDLKQAILNNIIKIEKMDKPEIIEKLSAEIDNKAYQLDKLNKDVKSANSLAEKNIGKIQDRKFPKDQEQRLINEEYKRAQNKVAEIMDEQAEIKRQLIEPKELIEKISGKYYQEEIAPKSMQHHRKSYVKKRD